MPLASSTKQLNFILSRLWCHIDTRRRTQLAGLLALMVMASFAEVLTLGAVVPFLGVLTSPEKAFLHPTLQPMILMLGITEPSQLLLPLTIAFAGAALLNGVTRLLLLWGATRMSVLIGADLSIDMYRRTLYQPYALHISRNSSDIINTISTKIGVTIHVLLLILNLLSSAMILVAILAALFTVDTKVALLAMAGFSLIYTGVIRITRRSLLENSEQVARQTTLVIKSLQEGLGGIRDVLLDGSQAVYCEIYRQADYCARVAQGNSGFLAGAPRFAVEALVMLFIAGLAYFIASEPGGIISAIPVLGALALGAQRMLPIMQQAFASWAGIKSSQASLSDALDLLEQPLPAWADSPVPEPIPFAREIHVDHLSFRYGEQGSMVLNEVDFVIPRGARIGFVGPTGSGKSTLLDIVMGLLSPSSGQLKVDGQPVQEDNRRAWQVHLAHVPQTVFLADASVEENIAFGVPRHLIDRERVRKVALRAQIVDTIESWPQQFETRVGERGVRLSGGQRQRLGIARALYKRADVIVFDEATSALDSETEAAVMEAINGLDPWLTVLMIAHRTSTLRNCDRIYEIQHGRIIWSGSYQDLCARIIEGSTIPITSHT
ncbi:ABC transporter ATP-binding protein/permease [Laribacter hongkongensis]|uniref:ABC transporter ATP-binding protein n=1 Tax=Laribacter hongkongensis TaxID=168471 RepID=UPI001EFEBAC7|nr:ABC transporter ATP-binding protein [Laribacter hongkongensis]MCG9051765.1 ABC transporter ATP-binding protein/permease [Laribacter hongkongensis]